MCMNRHSAKDSKNFIESVDNIRPTVDTIIPFDIPLVSDRLLATASSEGSCIIQCMMVYHLLAMKDDSTVVLEIVCVAFAFSVGVNPIRRAILLSAQNQYVR